MSRIWQYQAQTQSAPILKKAFLEQACPCCATRSELVLTDMDVTHDSERYSSQRVVRVCPECGWWIVSHDQYDASCGASNRTLRDAVATGAALTLLDPILTPEKLDSLCDEIEKHIKGHGKARHWKTLEDATAAILRNFGVEVVQTGKRGDGGMDVVIRSPNVPLGVVQVKHSKNKIGAGVMRELVGTSTLEESKHAIIVASSQFTAGAYFVQDAARQVGLTIELVDGPEILNALRLTTRMAIPRLRDLIGIAPPSIQIIREEMTI